MKSFICLVSSSSIIIQLKNQQHAELNKKISRLADL